MVKHLLNFSAKHAVLVRQSGDQSQGNPLLVAVVKRQPKEKDRIRRHPHNQWPEEVLVAMLSLKVKQVLVIVGAELHTPQQAQV